MHVSTETVSVPVRCSITFMLNPRTVLFLGYRDNHLATPDYDLTQTDRTVFAKIGYAWRV